MYRLILLLLVILMLAACTPTMLPPSPEALAAQSAQKAREEAAICVTIPELPPEVSPEELASEEPPDAVTREDTLLLLGDGEKPPQNEGETEVVAEEDLYDFPMVENDKVDYFIRYYSEGNGRKGFSRWLQRSGRYVPMIQEIFADKGLPLDLAYLAMVESGFNPRAYSWAHAAGPWQFIESTGKIFGLKNDWWRDERRDYEKATVAAARFLKDLYRCFDGDWYLAVASYNAGSGKLRKAIKRYGTRDFWELSHGDYLQKETKNYLPKLLAVLRIVKHLDKYNFTDIDYLEPFQYETVTIPTATDLEIVARLCGVDYDRIKELNPELKRWCTPPGVKDYILRVPVGTVEAFLVGYAKIPETERANYLRHKIASGDTLLALAQRYNIRVDDIISLNGITNPRALRVGTDLILPLKKGFSRQPIEELTDDYNRTRRRIYTVRSGDSLWKIARRFDVGVKDLRVWNRLGWSDLVRPGQVLVVSAKGAKRSVPRKKKSASSKSGKLVTIVYKVKSGDTLWGIGRKYDVSTQSILDWNSLSKDDFILPGQHLTLTVREDKRG